MKFGMFFELQMPKPWGANAEYNTFWQAIEQVVYAEEMGFERAWLVEHHFLTEFAHSSAPEVTLAIMAERTSTMPPGVWRRPDAGAASAPCGGPGGDPGHL